jgi:hypothetical protein
MRCSEFRDLHCSFVDDTLAGVELVRMQQHIDECPECAAWDAKIRRSLMLVRSIQPIEPSADFNRRLEVRLEECRLQDCSMGASFRTVALIGAIASAVMLGYVTETLRTAGTRDEIILPPVIAIAMPPAPPVADSFVTPAPAIVASVSAGMPFWPAALLVEQGPLQLVSYTQGR